MRYTVIGKSFIGNDTSNKVSHLSDSKIKCQLHFRRSLGCCRYGWNFALNLVNETYKGTGKGLGRFAIQKAITELKKEHEWMSEPYSQCLQIVARNLSKAFVNFFERRSGYPSFKSNHGRQSISYPQNVKVLDSWLTDKTNRQDSSTC